MRTIDQISIKEHDEILDSLREAVTTDLLKGFAGDNDISPVLCSQLASQVFLELLTVFTIEGIIQGPVPALERMIRNNR